MTDNVNLPRSVVEQALKAIRELEYSSSTAVADKMARDAKQALHAALEKKPCHSPYCECTVGECTHPGFYDARHEPLPKELLNAAPPQPPVVEQVPVAWAIFVDSGNARMWSTFQPHIQKFADAEGLSVTPLYTHPQPRQPLTEEQIMAIGRELGLKCRLGGNPNIDFDYARAIERAHGIRGEE